MLMAFALTYATCLLLSLAMNRHFQQVWPTKTLSPRNQSLLRNGDWLLLIITVGYCAELAGIAVGLVLIVGLFSAAACVLSLLLQYAPRMALNLVIVAPLTVLM
jgi:flagellar biosynthesis protein FliQ